MEYSKYIKPILAENTPTETFTMPVSVTMRFVFPKYKTSNHPTYRADLDNLAKIPMDEMTKLNYWTDDNLVAELILNKRFANDNEEPHTIIEIRELETTQPVKLQGAVADQHNFTMSKYKPKG